MSRQGVVRRTPVCPPPFVGCCDRGRPPSARLLGGLLPELPSNGLVFGSRASYFSSVRRTVIQLGLLGWLMMAVVFPAAAESGQVMKVLPHFLDTNGLHTLSPSLYERDAYQAYLRQHPENRSGVRFDVQWKAKGPSFEPRTLKLELRGIAKGSLPRELTLEHPVTSAGWFGRWTSFPLIGDKYRDFGEVTAWRVTPPERDQLLGGPKSFLWESAARPY